MDEMKPNVLLVVIDSLRADFIASDLMPRFNELRGEAVNFDRAFAQGISSAPSMASMLTGTWPLDYGGHWYLHESRTTIAEILKANGYHTAAIHSNPNLSRLRNFDKGFDFYDESFLPWVVPQIVDALPEGLLPLANKFFRLLQTRPYLPAERLNQITLRRIRNANRPWFFWMQYMDVHGPYLSHRRNPYLDKLRAEMLYQKAMKNPGQLASEEKEELKTNYQAEISYLDRQLGGLVTEFRDLGLWDEMLVVITADHGDEFGEHGLFGHKNKPYEELIHVPLMIKFPVSFPVEPGTCIAQPVRLLDVLPTILDVNRISVGNSIQRQIEGKSLVPLAQTGDDGSSLFDYIVIEKEVKGSDKLRIGIRTEEWKFIFDGEEQTQELYHLAEDPMEQQNVIDDYPEIAGEFEDVLKQRLSQIAERSASIKIPDISESKEVEERLKALGYIE